MQASIEKLMDFGSPVLLCDAIPSLVDKSNLLANLDLANAFDRLGVDNMVTSTVTVKSVDRMEQIVTGEVYAPYVIDSHGEMMLPEDIKKMAHRFLIANKNHFIDMMHNNKVVQASVVESYIAKANDPDYTEGAWVLSVKIFDENVWGDVLEGKLNGYSFEAMVYKVDAEVVYDYLPLHIGFTEENDGHFHAFYVEVDENGRVIGGKTSVETDSAGRQHDHKMLYGTATQNAEHGAHRYFLNEIEHAD